MKLCDVSTASSLSIISLDFTDGPARYSQDATKKRAVGRQYKAMEFEKLNLVLPPEIREPDSYVQQHVNDDFVEEVDQTRSTTDNEKHSSHSH